MKSNAILLADDGASVGVGMGQVNRVDSCRLAVSRAGEERARGAVAASDAFFPFADGLQVLLDAGVRAVVAPGGSVRDDEVVEAARSGRGDHVLHRHPALRPLMQAGTSWATLAAAAAAAFVGGAVMSLQARMNGELSTGFRAPLDAAMWSFGSGAVLLSLLLLAAPGVRAAVGDLPAALRDGRLRWWQCIGGVGGGAFVVTQTYAVPLAGVAIFTIAVVGGQTLNALLVDKLGLGPAGRAPVTPARAASAALAFVGVVVAVGARGGGGGSRSSSRPSSPPSSGR